MKMIIYKIMGVYHCTTKENYNARIQNARLIQRLEDFENASEIIEYYCQYFGCKTEDFDIIE